MVVRAILASTYDGVIGLNGSLPPWRLPGDLKRFQSLTIGDAVAMGRKTLMSIGKPLHSRGNFVFTRNRDFNGPKYGVIAVTRDPADFLSDVRASGRDTIGSWPSMWTLDKNGNALCISPQALWIIGGASIYAQAMPFVYEVYLTLVKRYYDGDTRVDLSAMLTGFNEISREVTPECDYIIYRRNANRLT